MASAQLDGLSHPNGIVFTPDYSGLWIDQDIGNTLDHVAYAFRNPANPSAPNVTHVAIQPGTRRAFVTASGPGGGYIYTFQALAPAPATTPNGG